MSNWKKQWRPDNGPARTAKNTKRYWIQLSEILNLRWKDIALKPKIIYIIKSKNGERRNIPISIPIARWLRELKDEATGDYVLDNQGQPLTKRRRGVRIGKEPVLKTGER